MKTLYLECNMGAAGDMLLAALYELLPDQKGFLEKMNALLPGVRLDPRAAKTCGIAGTHMAVTVDGVEEESHDHADILALRVSGHHDGHGHDHGHGHHHHASPGHIAELIDKLSLPEEARSNARAVYDSIAAAEAQAHGCEVGDVHFHEVGALDAVADVAGVCYALHLLKPGRILASPVHMGAGQVRCAHGVVPVPAPATAILLKGIPSYGGAIWGELCTPTGAALLRQFVPSFGHMPVMSVEKTGYGLGKKEFEAANCVRAFWGDSGEGPGGEISELTCNLDDMTPEALAYACRRLLELGALDVYTTPGVMKKGRAGQVLTVLCPPEREEEVVRAVFAQTTTNGLRARRCGKYFMAPGTVSVDTPYGPVRVKRAEGWGACHSKPEYEDVAAAAQAAGVPFREVWESAADRARQG